MMMKGIAHIVNSCQVQPQSAACPERVSVYLWVNCKAMRYALKSALQLTDMVDDITFVFDHYHLEALKLTNDVSVIVCCSENVDADGLSPQDTLVVGETNEQALHAFSARAAGFIQYPLSQDQLDACLARHLSHLQQQYQRGLYDHLCQNLSRQSGISRAALTAKLNRMVKQRSGQDRLALRSASEWVYIDQSEIRWIDAAGDYLVVHCQTDNHVVRCTLCDMARKLDERFIRISRSAIVNRDIIKRAEKLACKVIYLVLEDDVRLKISRRYSIDPKIIDNLT